MTLVNLVREMSNGERNTLIPSQIAEYVKWGNFDTISKILKSGHFTVTYITGLSGNGKTTMVEQVCANLKRECIRVNITAETDEDDLLGGMRLIDGNTQFVYGPVIEAMRRGSVLLLDEVDLGSDKLMCLQPVLEGKGIYLKKINEFVQPAKGFAVVATANTKGRGGDHSDRFVGTKILNEAFLDRYNFTIEQEYPPRATEERIVKKYMESMNVQDEGFADKLVRWADIIRKSFYEGAVDDVISTRRLIDIVKGYSIFGNKEVAIKLALARFDVSVAEGFYTLYSKLDDNMVQDGPAQNQNQNEKE
jgi:midasin (ATPase involved in ribosome maturation)